MIVYRDNFRHLSGTPHITAGYVALTFDDGPGPNTRDLARLLHTENVPATFFVLGESLLAYHEALNDLRECGHTIALHGDDHRPFDSSAMAKAQLDRCRMRIGSFPGDRVWFRPPFGRFDVKAEGYYGPVGWDADGEDWRITYREGHSVARCVEMIAARLRTTNGGIVLLHDFVPASELMQKGLAESDLDQRVLEITSVLIYQLRRDGFSFVNLTGGVVPSGS